MEQCSLATAWIHMHAQFCTSACFDLKCKDVWLFGSKFLCIRLELGLAIGLGLLVRLGLRLGRGSDLGLLLGYLTLALRTVVWLI